MVDAGFFTLELHQVELAFTKTNALPDDVTLRVDFELLNGPENLQWAASGKAVLSTDKMRPFVQAPEPAAEVPADPLAEAAGSTDALPPPTPLTKYILGFPDGFVRRSTYLSLEGAAVTRLANMTLSIKVLVVKDPPAAPTEVKKGAPPPPAVATEDPLVEVTVPLASLVRAPGGVVDGATTVLDTDAVAAVHPEWRLAATTHPAGAAAALSAADSVISWRLAADDDLAEYLMGGSLVSYLGAALPAPPAAWGLHSADVVDPKAKVPPSAADLRKKYLENIEKMVAVQEKYAVYTAEIRAVDDGGGLSLPAIALAPGRVAFDTAAAAAAADADENLREMGSLWSVAWGPSPLSFLHRTAARALLAAAEAGAGGAAALRYSLVMTKAPVAPDGVTSEGADTLTLLGDVDIAPLLGLDGSGRPVEIATLTVTNVRDPAAVAAVEAANAAALAAADAADPADDGEAAPVAEMQPLPVLDVQLSVTVTAGPALRPVPAALPPPVRPAVASLTSKPNPFVDGVRGLAGKAAQAERDVMKELRVEIASVIKTVALEYVTRYPAPVHVPPPLALGAPPPTGASSVANPDAMAERKVQFMHYLSTSGVYHGFKERLKPKIQRVARARYGARGQALGLTAPRGRGHDAVPDAEPHPSAGDRAAAAAFLASAAAGSGADVPLTREELDSIMAELYVFLVKETDQVLNALYTGTVVDKDLREFDQLGTPGAALDDETESPTQRLTRLGNQAADAEAAAAAAALEGPAGVYSRRFYVAHCEQLHLERVQLVNTDPLLQADLTNVHAAYAAYGTFCLHQSAASAASAAAGSSGAAQHLSAAKTFMDKGRRALEIAYGAQPQVWFTSMLYACALVEADQREEAEGVLTAVINTQLTGTSIAGVGAGGGYGGNNGKGGLPGLLPDGAFDGYDSDKLVPVAPVCYAVAAAFFTLLQRPLQARKALRLADRSYLEGDYTPSADRHGTPRRTVVLVLASAVHVLLDHGCASLGKACADLATQSEKAVTDKAVARGLRNDTVPFIRHALLRATARARLAGAPLVALSVDPWNEPDSDAEEEEGAAGAPVAAVGYDPSAAASAARDSVLAADDVEDKIRGLLIEASALAQSTENGSAASVPAGAVVEAYTRALQLALAEEQRRAGLDMALPLSAPGGPGGLSNHPSTVSLTSVTSVQPYDPAAEPPKPMPSDVLKLLPVEVFVHAGRLLLGGDRAAEAYEVLAHGARVHTSAALFQALGTAAYRLDRLQDAEDALMEACLLDNRCPDTWLALALVCLACSLTADATRPAKQRRDEAEQAAKQGLRLRATNAPVLRELAAAFVAADRVQAAEEVVRRAGAVESAHDGGNGSGNGRPHPHTRKLLADILAVQNHALAAVDEYREVLGDAAADGETKRAAADQCAALLRGLGREEELHGLRRLVDALGLGPQVMM